MEGGRNPESKDLEENKWTKTHAMASLLPDATSKTETTTDMTDMFDDSDLSRTGPHKDYYYDATEINNFESDGVPLRCDPADLMKMRLKPVEETIAHYTQQLNDPTIKSVVLKHKAASSTPVCTPTEPMATVYTCRKCRCLLFLHEDLMTHTASQQTFSYKKKKKDRKATATATMSNASPSTNKKQADECGVHFLHLPTEWMSESEGKIHCPKCTTRLGSFSWSGSQCSCGSWITPSISFPKSKVDVKKRSATNVNTMQQLLSKLTLATTGDDEQEKETTTTTTESTAAQTKFDPAQIKELAEMGFDEPLIKIALEKNKHVVQDAMTWLFSPEAMDFVQAPASSETQQGDY